MAALPTALRGPVQVALAKTRESIPGEHALPGGSMYELKCDGFRCALVRDGTVSRSWSRQGKDLTDHFPDVARAATAQVPSGTVLDGELVIWNEARLDFDLLQRRLVTGRPARAAALAVEHPASYMVFDLLAAGATDLRSLPLRERRATLEILAAGWVPPLQVSPVTTSEAQARAWFVDYRPAGIEGLVVKAAAGAYAPGRRDWVKVKSRETAEVIIGAVTGSIRQPESVVVGLMADGQLAMVGKSVPLTKAQAETLGTVLTPAGPDHPWPDEVSSNRFGSSRAKVVLTKVKPVLVAEIMADAALHAGAFRHPVRFIRHRPDLTVADVPPRDRP